MRTIIILIALLGSACAKSKPGDLDQSPQEPQQTLKFERCHNTILSTGGQAFKVNIVTDQPEPIPDGTYGFEPYTDWFGHYQPGCHYTIEKGLPGPEVPDQPLA